MLPLEVIPYIAAHLPLDLSKPENWDIKDRKPIAIYVNHSIFNLLERAYYEILRDVESVRWRSDRYRLTYNQHLTVNNEGEMRIDDVPIFRAMATGLTQHPEIYVVRV